ncbi:MAG: squalene/phytoene synthase family protein [Hyphomonadaceae bacterium]|nr:squalene/phytoene synthase family protein [Hyphomonadaceae bacterium]
MSELEPLVRQADNDRWLASRFGSSIVRERLGAIYAVFHEVSRARIAAREPALAAIRLAWWRDALLNTHAGAPAPHPVLRAYSKHAPGLPAALWTQIVEAMNTSFSSWDAACVRAERVQGGLMRLALHAASADGDSASAYLPSLATAWGLMRLCADPARDKPGPIEEGVALALRFHARGAAAARAFKSAHFPAIGYTALVPLYCRAIRKGRVGIPLLQRQIRLTVAAATGRL